MLSDDLRHHIQQSRLSAFQLGTAVGTNPQTLRRFARGEVGLSQEISDRIGDHLGLALVKRGETPPELNYKDDTERRARELAAKWLTEGFDRLLWQRVLGERSQGDSTGGDQGNSSDSASR